MGRIQRQQAEQQQCRVSISMCGLESMSHPNLSWGLIGNPLYGQAKGEAQLLPQTSGGGLQCSVGTKSHPMLLFVSTTTERRGSRSAHQVQPADGDDLCRDRHLFNKYCIWPSANL